jgi:hypothetical protein
MFLLITALQSLVHSLQELSRRVSEVMLEIKSHFL